MDDGTLTPQAFAAGLRRFAFDPEVRDAWTARGAAEAWGWDWDVVDGRGGGAPTHQASYGVLKLTRAHPGLSSAPAAAAAADSEQQELETAVGGSSNDHDVAEPEPPDDDDDACLLRPTSTPRSASPSSSPSSVVDWEFHVVYSDVFRVPGLWLLAAWPDGRPLTEAELARALPNPPDVTFTAGEVGEGQGSSVGQQVVERWTMLSQDEHPALGRPACCLHPCGTAGRMRHLLGEGEQEGTETQAESDEMCGLAYLLKWFGLVAPVVGFPFPAAFAERVLRRIRKDLDAD